MQAGMALEKELGAPHFDLQAAGRERSHICSTKATPPNVLLFMGQTLLAIPVQITTNCLRKPSKAASSTPHGLCISSWLRCALDEQLCGTVGEISLFLPKLLWPRCFHHSNSNPN